MKNKYLILFALLLLMTACQSNDWVRDLTDGYVTAYELKKMLRVDYPVLLVDLRNKDQYTAFHIPTAVNIPSYEIETLDEYIGSNSIVVIYSKENVVQKNTYQTLLNLGYEDIYQLTGGINLWDDEFETGE